MKAMILAAGFGTRLKPLTETTPKALMPVANIPVLERNIEYLKSFGIDDIIINTHYLSEFILEFINGITDPKVNLTVRNEKEILGTGGGIANCRDFLDGDTFIVMNSDILTNIDIDAALKRHREMNNTATMLLHDQALFNQVVIKGNYIQEIHVNTGPERLAFTGIHILEPEIFNHLPHQGFFDIITGCYRPMLESGEKITAHVASGHYWFDIGTTKSYFQANKYCLDMIKSKILIGTDTHIDPSAEFNEWAVVGNRVSIGQKAVIERSIIWSDTRIGNDEFIKNSVATPGCTVKV